MSSETSGTRSDPGATTPGGAPPLVVTGVDGAVSRAVLRCARARGGVDDVVPGMRVPGTGELSADSAAQTPVVPARAVVFVGLSTDLALDLRLGRERRRAWLVEAVRAALACALAGPGDGSPARLVAITSARVYGALPDNPVPLPEGAPLRAVDDGGLVGDLLAVEDELAAARALHPDLPLTVLRPAAVVGPATDTTIGRHFAAARPLVLSESGQRWQFVHHEDLAEAALLLADAPGDVELPPAVTAGAPGSLPQVDVERLLGKRRLELPRAVAMRAAERLHALGRLSTSGAEIAYVSEPWVVDSATPTRLGWVPRYDNEACVAALRADLETRHASFAGRREAALGTASAAVALVASAAVIRRSRRRGAP